MKKNILLAILIMAFLGVTVGLIASLASDPQKTNSIWYENNIANIKSSFSVDEKKASAIYEILAACKREGAIEYISRWNDKSTGEIYYRVRFADGSKADVYLYDDGTVKVKDGEEILYEGGLYGVDAETIAVPEPDVADNGKDNNGDKSNDSGSDKDKETQQNNDIDTKTTDGNTENNIETSNNEPSSGSATTPDAETTTNKEKDTETTKPTDNETLPAVETTKADTETETTQDNTQKIEIIVNKSTKKFHYTYCSYVSRMKEENKLTIFVSSLSEAEDMGYSRCSYCTGKSK